MNGMILQRAYSEHRGKMQVDATVADADITFPTDLDLLNKAREKSEQIIDELYCQTTGIKKPRTYRQKARIEYLLTAKKKRKTIK